MRVGVHGDAGSSPAPFFQAAARCGGAGRAQTLADSCRLESMGAGECRGNYIEPEDPWVEVPGRASGSSGQSIGAFPHRLSPVFFLSGFGTVSSGGSRD